MKTPLLRSCAVVLLAVGLVVYSVCCNQKATGGRNKTNVTSSIEDENNEYASSPTTTSSVSQRLLLQGEASEQDLIKKIAIKLQPVQLQVIEQQTTLGDDNNKVVKERSTLPKLKPHQFLHLHHMKTGGTSIDHMMRCAMDRLRGKQSFYHAPITKPNKDNNNNNNNKVTEAPPPPTGQLYDVPYFNIHECSRSQFSKCLGNRKAACRPTMTDAAVMSYCAPLKHLEEFGWNEWGMQEEEEEERRRKLGEEDDSSDEEPGQEEGEDDNDGIFETNSVLTTNSSMATTASDTGKKIRAFTVLRHPVDRVWSMFKFQTKNCYKCMPLVDIYDLIDANTTTVTKADGTTHTFDELCLNQLRNHEVANLLTSSHWPAHPEDEETQAVAMVTEAVANIMKKYFTVIGLTEELVETRRILGKVFPWMNETLDGYKETCPLPHDNSSPSNNHCISNGKGKPESHWDLPKNPDEETRQAILAHNALDVQLYEAAVEYFELQKRALEWGEQQS
jgi:hypothetical protein